MGDAWRATSARSPRTLNSTSLATSRSSAPSGRDGLEIGIFYAAWGLMWIHSSYANYCLTGSSYGSTLSPPGANVVSKFKTLGPKVYPNEESGLNEAILDEIVKTA